MSYDLILGDVVKWSNGYTGEKFHAILTDPPYHLTTITKRFGKDSSAPAKGGVYNRASKGFMGQQWDGGELAFNPDTWHALSQHLHPGGFIMAFAGTRGYHRMASAIEDAGLIIHPALIWVNLSGFPKSTRVDIQCEQELCYCVKVDDKKEWFYKDDNEPMRTRVPFRSDMANRWVSHRYGLQAMKPALEFVCVAQKPYEGRPVDNIVGTGAGSLNIDGSRIPGQPESTRFDPSKHNHEGWRMNTTGAEGAETAKRFDGRWPANLILSEEGAELLDRQSGDIPVSGSAKNGQPATGDSYHLNNNVYGGGIGKTQGTLHNDSGGASRMFHQTNYHYEILEQLHNADVLKYEPKVSTAEREAGLDSLPMQTRNRVNSGGYEDDPKFAPTQMKNHHPTLKPISLTKYLATLLLPPDAYAPRRILVPFAGSGSEGIGALLAGWEQVTMIEGNKDYHAIATERVKWWSQWPKWGQDNVDKILANVQAKEEEKGQLSFFDMDEGG